MCVLSRVAILQIHFEYASRNLSRIAYVAKNKSGKRDSFNQFSTRTYFEDYLSPRDNLRGYEMEEEREREKGRSNGAIFTDI